MKRTRSKTTQPIKATGRYKVGDQFIYHNGKNLIDKVEIIEIIPGGYLLSNQVRMNESLKRFDLDAKKFDHTILPLNEDSLRLYESYYAYAQLLKALPELQRNLIQKLPFKVSREDQEWIILMAKKIKRLMARKD